MKKLVVITFIASAAFLNANNSQAQNIGGALGFGTEVESLGLGVFAQFPTANQDLIIAPSFAVFFPDNINFWELNANVNYVFSRSSATVYGIAGLNISHVGIEDIEVPFIGTVEGGSDTSLGLNIGAGVDLDTGSNFIPFFELKYAINDFDQLTIYGGLRFPLR